jgi:hypothetical protein
LTRNTPANPASSARSNLARRPGPLEFAQRRAVAASLMPRECSSRVLNVDAPGATHASFDRRTGTTSRWAERRDPPICELVQVMVIENVRSAVAPRSSVTRTVNENVPAVVGVPVMRPGLSERLSPGGNWPATSDQL